MAELRTQTRSDLRERIDTALREAEADAPEGVRASTLRLVACAIRDRDVTARRRGDCEGCPDAGVRDVLETMAEQRRVSAREFDESGRIADAEREREELAVIEEFLPQPLKGEVLEEAVQEVVSDLEARTLKDLGRCISTLKARYPGRIDPQKAGKAVRAALG